MTTYHPHGVKLSQGQKEKLAKAFKSNSAVTIRLSNKELSGNDQLMLTKRQINRLNKAKNMNKGSDINISKTQIRKAVVHGGSLWSSIFSLASKAAPALATGALSALGSMGIEKLIGTKKQKGGFLIHPNNINQLINYQNMLTKKQKEDIVNAMQTGGELIINPTKTQIGAGFGAILASIGIPLLLKALTGKGLHVERSRPRRSLLVHVPDSMIKNKDGGAHLIPWQSPPVVGTWEENNPIGFGLKKKNDKKKERKEKVFCWAKTVPSI